VRARQQVHALAIDERHTLQPAPVGRRFVAFILDFMLIASYLVVLLGVGVGVSLISGQDPPRSLTPRVMDLVAFLLAVLPVILYFASQEGSPAPGDVGEASRRDTAASCGRWTTQLWTTQLSSGIWAVRWLSSHPGRWLDQSPHRERVRSLPVLALSPLDLTGSAHRHSISLE